MNEGSRLIHAAIGAVLFVLAADRGAHALEVGAVGAANGSILFVENRGQFAAEALAQARAGGYTLWLTHGAMIFDFGVSAEGSRQWVRLDMPGSRTDAVPELRGPSGAKASFLLGNDRSRWRSGLELYREARYRDIYPDIDLRVYGKDGRIEYDFVVRPGGDPGRIRLVHGAKGPATIDARGDLSVELSIGRLVHRKPQVHQMVDGHAVELPAGFALARDGSASFRVSGYRSDRDLVIDPAVDLVYSSYLGGTRDDQGTAIATDSQGYIYVTTDTLSVDFPTGAPAVPERCSPPNYDFVVSKLTADGQTLVYSTYIGGNDDFNPWTVCTDANDHADWIAVNDAGEAFVAGRTKSWDFPMVNGLVNQNGGYYSQLFVLKLSQDGSTIPYSSVFGSDGNDDPPAGLVLDSDGFVYTAGTPDVNAFYMGGPWGVDANHYPIKDAGPECQFRTDRWRTVFVVKFDTSQIGDASVVYSRCVDPGVTVGNLNLKGMAIDQDANLYLGGNIEGGFPATPGAFRAGCVGTSNHAFLTKVSQGGNLLYSTNFCSAASGYPTYTSGLAVNAQGLAYLVGEAGVADADFDLLKYEFQQFVSGWHQGPGYLAVFDTNAAGEDSLVTATALAAIPDQPQYTNKVALDQSGNVYVAGNTNATNVIATQDAFQSAHAGGYWDCYLMQLPADGRWLYHSTYLGGAGADLCRAITADAFGNVLVTGATDSANFPTASPIQATSAGGADALLSVIRYDSLARLSAAVAIPERVFPGEALALAVNYRNDLDFDTDDTIVRMILPQAARYLGSTPPGIYLAASHEVFWKLGTVGAGQRGTLRATVQYDWGIPGHHFSYVTAEIDAVNAPSHPIPDLALYLASAPVVTVSESELTREQIDALLAANPAMSGLYQQALALGFLDLGVASERTLSDASTQQVIYMLEPAAFEQIQIVNAGGTAFALRFDESTGTFSAFDLSGGMSTYLRDNRVDAWGQWAEEVPSGSGAGLAPRDAATCKATTNRCLLNCLAEAGYSLTLGKIFSILGPLQTGAACTMCILDGSADSCYACQTELTKKLAEKATGADVAIDVSQCLIKCAGNPEAYVCDEDRPGCASGWDPYRTFMGYFNVEFRTVQTCNTLTCTLDAPQYIACAFGDVCVNGICKACSEVSGQGNCKKQEVITPHDPNRKNGPDGDLIDGQTLVYSIDYENTGDGTAYGVFIKDTVDANLDETTLAVDDGGMYFAPLRTLYWYVGDVPAHGTGAVSFSVGARPGLASGTTISNQAVVYFPSVLEETPTNVRVNRVYSLVAHPQTVETTAEVPVDITLTGEDAGASPLNFRVVSAPVYGDLSGTAPALTYTPTPAFSGSDQFSFVVNNGVVDSETAEVRVTVLPSAVDATAPAVTGVEPMDGDSDVVVSATTFGGGLYPPVVSATFSEPMDAATVSDAALTVAGVSGLVSYDEPTRTAFFTPLAPLAHATTYTATVAAAVTDLAGNPLAADHVWQFTTNSEVDINALLSPPELTGYDFGSVVIGTTSPARVVTVTSAGSTDLVLGSLGLTGSSADHFALGSDTCSGQTLAPGLACTATVALSPQYGGRKSALLSIPSNDADSDPVQITLDGIGVVAGGGYAQPGEGTVGTDIVLSGTGFGARNGKVLIDARKCTVMSWSDTSIGCRVRKPRPPGIYSVTVLPTEPRGAAPVGFADVFAFKPPSLDAGASTAAVGETVTVHGTYFSGPRRGSIRLGYVDGGRAKRRPCKVTAWQMDPATGASTASFVVPRLPAGSYDLILSNKVGSSVVTGGVTIP